MGVARLTATEAPGIGVPPGVVSYCWIMYESAGAQTAKFGFVVTSGTWFDMMSTLLSLGSSFDTTTSVFALGLAMVPAMLPWPTHASPASVTFDVVSQSVGAGTSPKTAIW